MRAIFAGLIVALAAGCDEAPEATAPERIRAIKPYYVNEPAGSDIRRYAGSLAATDTAVLAFPQSGTVATVEVSRGAQVTSGQVLATLDRKPFDLEVEAAQSGVASAKAQFVETRNLLARQRQLFERGWIARAALEQAEAAFDDAEAGVNLARTRLGTAERDRANSVLTAPFDGVIATRDVDPFEEVAAGQAMFLLNATGALDVNMSIPDTVVRRLAIGTPVTVDVSTIADCGCSGRITQIGVVSGAANAVTVKAALLDSHPELLPGMAAEVSIPLSGGESARGFLLPLTAIAPGDDAAPGYVFKFDADAGVVRRTPVRGGEGLSGNLVEVVEGITAGDVVAAAGVSFLRDGQSVTLLGE